MGRPARWGVKHGTTGKFHDLTLGNSQAKGSLHFTPPPCLLPQGLMGEQFKGMDLPRQAIPWPAMVCLHTPQTLGFLKSFFLKLWGHVVNSSGWNSKGRNCQHFSSWSLLFFFFISFLGDNKSSKPWKGLKEELYQANYSSGKESVDDILESRGQLTLCQ